MMHKRMPLSALFGYAVSKCSTFLKISHIVGSHYAFFSLSSICVPLLGVFGGLSMAFGTCFLGMGVRMAFGLPFILACAYHIPGLCASFYWMTNSKIARILAPLACMALFISHPVGREAWPYACYWLIPAFIAFTRNQSLFLTALGSTFMAHAVGSVFYLYALALPVAAWYSLIPVVMAERLIFASGMTLAYYGINALVRFGAAHKIRMQAQRA